MLRGSYTARIDDKGRLKLPTAFNALVEGQHGSSLYVTSLDGNSVLIYPMPVWLGVEERLARMPATHPTRNRYLNLVNFYGQTTELDSQGRIVIQARLRESAAMIGEVSVLGKVDYLEVWNFDRLNALLKREPFTDDDARVLAEHGV